MTFQKPLFIIILSLTFLSFSNCVSTKENGKFIAFQENTPFVIEGVTSQKTIAGTKDGGTSYRLTIPVTQAKEGVVFKELFFREQAVEAKLNPVVKSQYIGFFTNEKNDFIMDSDPKKEAENTMGKPFPFDLNDSEAVISYTYQDEFFYYKIIEVEQLDPIMLPSQNANNGLNKL